MENINLHSQHSFEKIRRFLLRKRKKDFIMYFAEYLDCYTKKDCRVMKQADNKWHEPRKLDKYFLGFVMMYSFQIKIETVKSYLSYCYSAKPEMGKWCHWVKIKGKKIYLFSILDMFNGEIVSYSIAYSTNHHMVMTMLEKAFKTMPIPDGLIPHSDQGVYYQRQRYQKV